tara:strand:+ start:2882 stop:3937 length:1056 start_codon:yes stop_codon:yes gene_type:complete
MKEKNKFRKKIYFVRANKTKFGGAELYLSRVSCYLDEKKVNHEVINSIFPRFLPSWIKVILFNAQVMIIKKNKFYFALDRILFPDIYRAGDGVHKTFLDTVKKNKFNPLHALYLFIEKRSFKNSTKIIAISEMVKNNIIDVYGVKEDKIHVIYNGIELKNYNYQISYEKLNQEFSISKEIPIILFVGSGFKRKGVEEFLYIISKLENKNFLAFVIGKEKKIDFYKNLAKSLKVNSKVIFTGPREDVDDFFTISDIFLFPTHYEPFGSVMLEAMNLKNAVFTTKQCGASELLESEYVMKNPADYRVINKIDELLFNNKSLNQVKEKNRNISKNFSLQKNLQQTLKLIDEVIN